MEIFSLHEERIIRAVRKNGFEDLNDDPDALRWRAMWDKTYEGEVIGVDLRPYPVARVTPRGAWIDPFGYRDWTPDGERWREPTKDLLRWVSNDGGAAWAKPTQQAAIDSLLYRYRRWGERCARDLSYFLAASATLKELFPDDASSADHARLVLRHRIGGVA